VRGGGRSFEAQTSSSSIEREILKNKTDLPQSNADGGKKAYCCSFDGAFFVSVERVGPEFVQTEINFFTRSSLRSNASDVRVCIYIYVCCVCVCLRSSCDAGRKSEKSGALASYTRKV